MCIYEICMTSYICKMCIENKKGGLLHCCLTMWPVWSDSVMFQSQCSVIALGLQVSLRGRYLVSACEHRCCDTVGTCVRAEIRGQLSMQILAFDLETWSLVYPESLRSAVQASGSLWSPSHLAVGVLGL